jgi:hypothetical protein
VEDRALLEDKAAGFGAIDFSAGDVGRQQVGGELNAMELRFDTFRQLFDGFGLGEAGRAFDQHMAVSQQRDQQAVNEFFLTENLR